MHGSTAGALAAVAERDAALRAFVTVREEAAGEEGVPLGVKDLFDTAGLRTTYGSAIFRDHVPTATAVAVERLQRAGYSVVGKTNLHEFAYGITSENEHYGDVRNPLDPSRIPGGSSGGSAVALAAGMCDAALGSDSGGSIRIPAACCGVVGFKPTHGLVPVEGLFPLAPSFDHAGPMARTVQACAEALAVLVPGFRPEPVVLADLRVGLAWTDLAEAGVRRRVEDAAARFPRPRRIDLPLAEGVTPAFMREVADVHRELLARYDDLYGEGVRTKVERCLAVTDDEYAEADTARERYRDACAEAVGELDLVIVPTLTSVAPPTGRPEVELRRSVIRLTFPFNALGWPALALPCGPAEAGLPASVSLVAAPGHDALVLGAGIALQQSLVRRRRP